MINFQKEVNVPKIKSEIKRRVQPMLSDEDFKLLEELAESEKTSWSQITCKAIRILSSLKKEEVYLTTPKGDRIPNSIIFS